MGRIRSFSPQADFALILTFRFALGLTLCSLSSSVPAGSLLNEQALIHKGI